MEAQRINVDFQRGVSGNISVTEIDSGRDLVFVLYNAGEKIKTKNGDKAILWAITERQEVALGAPLTLNGNEASITVPYEMLDGTRVYMQVELTTDGKAIKTEPIKLVVSQAVVNMSNMRRDTFVDLLQRTENKTGTDARIAENAAKQAAEQVEIAKKAVASFSTDEDARKKAESARASEENKRKQAETTRSDAEATRIKAEQGRVTAETARVEAEKARAQSETARISAEQERQRNEAERKRAEAERQPAEQKRNEAEQKRSEAEQSRAQAEGNRALMEEARMNADQERENAERIRQAEESKRQQSERERGTAEQARVKAESGRVTADGERTQRANEDHTRLQTLIDTLNKMESGQIANDVALIKSKLQTYASRLDTLTAGELDTTLDTIKELADAIKKGGADVKALTSTVSGKADKTELATEAKRVTDLLRAEAQQAKNETTSALAGKADKSQLSNYIPKSDIANVLYVDNPNRPLSASMGKVLNGYITSNKTEMQAEIKRLDGKIDSKPNTPVVDSLTSTSTTSALSANQGKILKGLIDNKPNTPVVDNLTSSATTYALSANQGRLLASRISTLEKSGAGGFVDGTPPSEESNAIKTAGPQAVLDRAFARSHGMGRILEAGLGLIDAPFRDCNTFAEICKNPSHVRLLVNKPEAFKAIFASSVAPVILLDNATNLADVMNSMNAMQALAGSATAMNAVAGTATAMNAVAGSATAMNAVVGSATAMNAVVGSATAMNAVAGSATAMNAVAGSAPAMNAVAGSAPAMNAVAGSAPAMNALYSRKKRVAGAGKYVRGRFIVLEVSQDNTFDPANYGDCQLSGLGSTSWSDFKARYKYFEKYPKIATYIKNDTENSDWVDYYELP